MHVIVVGCGRTGAGLAVELIDAGHSVAIIDKLPRAFRRLPAGWPGQRIVGFGFDRDHLEQGGAKRADALAAVTSGDNSNILCARIARETYEIQNVVARIYDSRRPRSSSASESPPWLRSPGRSTMCCAGSFPNAPATEWSDSTGRLHLIERLLPIEWEGRPLPLGALNGDGIRVVAVTRAGCRRSKSAVSSAKRVTSCISWSPTTWRASSKRCSRYNL